MDHTMEAFKETMEAAQTAQNIWIAIGVVQCLLLLMVWDRLRYVCNLIKKK